MFQSVTAVRSAAVAVFLVFASWNAGQAEDRTVVVEHFSNVA